MFVNDAAHGKLKDALCDEESFPLISAADDDLRWDTSLILCFALIISLNVINFGISRDDIISSYSYDVNGL